MNKFVMRRNVTFADKLKVGVIVAICFCSNNICVGASQEDLTNKAILRKGKKLVSREMALLDVVLEPVGVLRMELAQRAAIKTLKDFSTAPETKEYLDSRIDEFIEPIKAFLDLIQDHNGIIKPLIEESLADLWKEESKFYLLDFFDSGMSDAGAFFKGVIKKKIDLRGTCLELVTLIRDLKANLSDDTINACKALVVELKKEKVKKAATAA